MKLITEYLEHAISFERMAAEESNPEVKVQFEKQATAYRKARRRARGEIWTTRAEPAKSEGIRPLTRSTYFKKNFVPIAGARAGVDSARTLIDLCKRISAESRENLARAIRKQRPPPTAPQAR